MLYVPLNSYDAMQKILSFTAKLQKEDVEKTAMANEQTIKHLDGNSPKKVIVVPGKIVNIVI